MQKKNVRLSKEIVPINYDIQLKPDLENFTFEGIETITLSILKNTKIITLHSKEIEILTASAEALLPRARGSKASAEKIFTKISYNKENETASFLFPKIIEKGKIKLTLVFRGILNDKMRGFYRSRYSIGGKELHMATTQFEATDARRAFPCFDEPAQKAVFNVSLVIPKGKIAISNTFPISVMEHEAGFEIVKFSPTPKMSTYLLAFIIGDFDYVEQLSSRGVIVRVYTIPGKKHQAEFALDCAIKTLEFYEKYFDITYPLSVLDMVAIPDFASGAMENWGAITYRESALLVDENNSSTSNKQWVALVIAHEIAHQWFGNLVTMEWWTHLWLNEGFASYIEYLAVDKLFPEWNIWTQFANNDLGIALRLDALESTHTIEVEVHNPSEIGEIFDTVSYSKGASVIRMLADYLGEKDFRNGLRYYLKKHSYKNTETVHLWQSFEKVSKKPITKVMQNWTSKPGYPVIKTEIKKNKLSLSQSRFFANPISQMKNKKTTTWQVPITIVDGKSNKKILLSNKSLTLSLQNDWFKLNTNETGFYRTAYSKELLEKLVLPVQAKVLSPVDRLGLIRDLFALCEAGTIPTTDTLEFLKTFTDEDDFTVWLELATGLTILEQLLPNEPLLKKLSLDLFSPVAIKLSWDKKDSDTHADILLRSIAISRAGRSGNNKIIKEAREKFKSIQKGQHVSPDIRGAIYSIIATWGDMKEYNALIKRYQEETLIEEKNRIGNSLGDFANPIILEKACEFSMSKHVRMQDTVSILSSVGFNPKGRNIWWNFMQKNWKTLVSRYGEGGLTLGRAVTAIRGSAEEKHLKAFKKFFATHEAPGAKRAIEQVMERMEGNVAWLKRDGKSIQKFLRDN